MVISALWSISIWSRRGPYIRDPVYMFWATLYCGSTQSLEFKEDGDGKPQFTAGLGTGT